MIVTLPSTSFQTTRPQLLDSNSVSNIQNVTSNQMFGGSLLSLGADFDEGASLAQELNKLSLEEREQVLYDLHGVSSANDGIESPELIQQALSSFSSLLHKELDNPNETEILRTARLHAHDRLTDPSFHLLFLRADDFDIRRAFNRMLCYFEEVRFLFGNDVLGRRVTLSDLNSKDREVLDMGYTQMLPAKDSAGRSVLFASIPHTIKFSETYIALFRAAWYLFMSHLENDEEAQTNGIVVVLSYIGMKSNFWSPTMAWQAHKLVEAIPMRFVAHHGLIETREFGFFLRFRKLWEQRRRLRSRAHYGTYLECIYALMTFGIPTDVIPLTPNGEIQSESHREQLRQNEIRESQSKRQSPSTVTSASPTNFYDSADFALPVTPASKDSSVMVPFLSSDLRDQLCTESGSKVGNSEGVSEHLVTVIPERNDVLFGRGRPIQEHHGNVVFNNLLDAVRDRYDGLRRSEKTALTLTIVTKIKRAGGRFLRQDPSNPEIWEEVDDEAARIKVSHTFRSLRQLHKHKEPTP